MSTNKEKMSVLALSVNFISYLAINIVEAMGCRVDSVPPAATAYHV